jgi:hypothetical protein
MASSSSSSPVPLAPLGAGPVAPAPPVVGDPMIRLAQLEAQFHALRAASPPPAAAGANPHRPKAPPMTLFTGLMGAGGFEIDQWLREVNKQFAHFGVRAFPDDRAKIAFAVEWMSGAAQDWWDNEDKNGIVSWDSFVERLRHRYRPQMPAELARQRLRTLTQRGRCETYCNEFLKLVARIPDRSEDDKIFDFKVGLDRPLAAKVAEKQPKTLQEAMEIAVQAEPYVSLRGGLNSGNLRPMHNAFSRPSAPVSGNSGAAPMELNYAGWEPEAQYAEFHEPSSNRFDADSDAGASSGQSVDHMQLMLAKIEAMESRLHSMQGSSNNRPSATNGKSNGGRPQSRGNLVPGLSAADVASLQKEGRCFRCKQKGHMKNECPQSQGRLKY